MNDTTNEAMTEDERDIPPEKPAEREKQTIEDIVRKVLREERARAVPVDEFDDDIPY
jgi:hypothetical protein